MQSGLKYSGTQALIFVHWKLILITNYFTHIITRCYSKQVHWALQKKKSQILLKLSVEKVQ